MDGERHPQAEKGKVKNTKGKLNLESRIERGRFGLGPGRNAHTHD